MAGEFAWGTWCWVVMRRYGVALLVHWVEIDMN